MTNDAAAEALVVALLAANDDVAPPVCLTRNLAAVGQVRRALRAAASADETAAVAAPCVIAIPSLLQILAQASSLSVTQAVDIAAWHDMPLTSDSHRQALRWRLFRLLEDSVQASRIGRLQLSEKLAELFIALDSTHVIGDNPFENRSDKSITDSPQSHEWEVARLVWAGMAEQASDKAMLLHHNLLWQRLAHGMQQDFKNAKLFTLVDVETPPLHHHYLKQMGAQLFSQAEVPEVVKVAGYQPLAITDAAVAGKCECVEASAPSLDATAALALKMIRHFAGDENKEDEDANNRVGVIVYDRLLARRVRSLAESQNVFIEDNIGWRLETLSVGSGIKLFVDLTLGAFDAAAVTRCLSAPYFCSPPQNDHRTEAQQEWYKVVSESLMLPESLDEAIALQLTNLSALLQPLQAAQQGMPAAGKARAPVQAWARWLVQHAQTMLAAWEADDVAQQVFARLQQVESADALTADEFYLWMNTYLSEEVVVTEAGVESRVAFALPTSVEQFSAVVLLGFGDTKLSLPHTWLGERENQQLGIFSQRKRVLTKQRRFFRIMSHHQRVGVVWQSQGDAEETISVNPLWRIVMQARQEETQAWTQDLLPLNAEAESLPQVQRATSAGFACSKRKTKLRISSMRDLMICPYHFYAQHFLVLPQDNEQDEETLEFFIRGRALHELLQEFVRLGNEDDDRQILKKRWHKLLDSHVQTNRVELKYYLHYWRVHANELVKWELARRAAGWQTRKTEYKVRWQARCGRVLSGRIDRLDAAMFNAQSKQKETWAIIDYKSGARLPSRKAIIRGEYPQIWLYWMGFEQTFLNMNVREVSLAMPAIPSAKSPFDDNGEAKKTKKGIEEKFERGDVKTFIALQDIAAKVEEILDDMEDSKNDELMVANGIMENCQKCASAVLCRKAHWLVEEAGGDV